MSEMMDKVLDPNSLTDEMIVTALRANIYSIKSAYEVLAESGAEGITLQDVIEVIELYAKSDLSCGFGHELDGDEIQFFFELGSLDDD
jgi:hypothetical protein